MAHLGELSRKSSGNMLSDMILGGQDGLVNVLGVILGVAAASNDPKIVIAGGLAATFAESISMAAVALTSKMAERDHFIAELAREKREIVEMPEKEESEIRCVYKSKGFDGKILDDITNHVISNRGLWLDQMMKEELELKPVTQKEIYTSSFVVGLSALVGSFIPLTPYFFLPIKTALWPSLAISAIILFLVGVYKAKMTVGKPAKSGIQMAIIGMTAALAGYLIGKLFGGH
ncbi:MAG: VIT1/CCC1 transporter family protein [Candidatus Berkelbacteria bacterium]|nr:VIT1/CCC1 transporter family protein [Candidatus Berkelbacteria bacterium]